MARQRMLHPGFFTDSDVCSLPPLHRLLFQGLWCEADREGRLVDRPLDLKIRLLPLDTADVNEMLADLEACGRTEDEPGLIVRYVVAGKRYIQIPKFAKYQHPHQREPASAIPGPGPAQVEHRASTGLAPGQHRASRAESESESESESDQEALSAGADPNGGQTPLLDVVSSPASDSPEAFQALWNETAHPDLPRWRAMTDKRRAAAKARIRDRRLRGSDISFQAVIRRINNTSFCLGANKTGWRASPDWLLQPDTADKVLEGKYDRPGERVEDTGPPERQEPRDAAEALWFRVLGALRDAGQTYAIECLTTKSRLRARLDGDALVLTGLEAETIPWVRGMYGQLLSDTAAQLNITISLEDYRAEADSAHSEPEASHGQHRVSRAAG